MRPPGHPILRLTSIVVGFCVGLAGVVGIVGLSTRSASLEPGRSKLDTLSVVEERIALLTSPGQEGDTLRIAFMGDSTADPPVRINSLPFRLNERLSSWRTGGPPAEVYSLAAPALGSVTYHFLAPDIIAAEPDLIVWQVAFAHTNSYWLRGNTHHEFAGQLSILDLADLALLPIHHLDLSADDLLEYKLLMAPGLRSLWAWTVEEQSRVQKARNALEKGLVGEESIGPELGFGRMEALNQNGRQLVRIEGRARFAGKRAIHQQGEGLRGLRPDHVVARILGKTLALFRDAEIPVVIYLNPINIEYLRSIGVVDEDLLRTSVETYRSVAAEYGATFIDFHDALPDASFVDAQGHFHRTEAFDAAGRMIDRIQPAVTNELDRIVRRRASAQSLPSSQSGR